MNIIQPNNDAAKILMQLAALQEETARRLEQKRQVQTEEDRQMGVVAELARRLGYEPKVQNPFYREQTQITPGIEALSRINIAPGEQLVSAPAGAALSWAEQMAKPGQAVYAPDAPIDETGASKLVPGTMAQTEKPLYGPINQMGDTGKALNALYALKAAGRPIDENTVRQVANINNPAYQQKYYNKEEKQWMLPDEAQTRFNLQLPAWTEQARGAKAWNEEIKRTPAYQEKYVKDETAGGMESKVIKWFTDVIKGKSDDERAKYYFLATKKINDIDTIYRRNQRSPDEMLGPLKLWLNQPAAGAGTKTMMVQVLYDNGEQASIAMPKNAPVGFDFTKFAQEEADKVKPEKGKKSKKVVFALPAPTGTVYGPGQQLKDLFNAQQVVDKTPDRLKPDVARKLGFDWDDTNERVVPRGMLYDASVVSGQTASDIANQYNRSWVDDILGMDVK